MARETEAERMGDLYDEARALERKFEGRGTSGKAEKDKQLNLLFDKREENLDNIRRYGKDAPKGRSFGKTRVKTSEPKEGPATSRRSAPLPAAPSAPAPRVPPFYANREIKNAKAKGGMISTKRYMNGGMVMSGRGVRDTKMS